MYELREAREAQAKCGTVKVDYFGKYEVLLYATISLLLVFLSQIA